MNSIVDDLHHFVDRRQRVTLLSDHLTIQQDSELSTVAFDDIHVDIRSLSQCARQTGGMSADDSSDGAVAYFDRFHGNTSTTTLCILHANEFLRKFRSKLQIPLMSCR